MCLIDRIDFKKCGNSEIRLINELPGITTESIESIREVEDYDYNESFLEIKKRAYNALLSDALEFLRVNHKLKTLTDNLITTDSLGESLLSGIGGVWRGFILSRATSPFQMFQINTIRIYSTTVTTTTVKIWEVNNFLNNILFELNSISVNLVEGWNEVKIYLPYTQKYLFIGYDSTNVTTYDIYSNGNWCCDDCVNTCGVGLTGANYDGTTLNKSSNFYGASLNFSVTCNYESLLCNDIKETLNLYLWYVGIEIMKERLFSTRVNRFTFLDADKAKEWLNMYEKDVYSKVGKYFGNIHLNNDCCIECDPQYSVQSWLP